MKQFTKGDKAIVRRKPLTVTISKATPYWNDYYCNKCGRLIKPGNLYGRYSKGDRFCLNCCEETS